MERDDAQAVAHLAADVPVVGARRQPQLEAAAEVDQALAALASHRAGPGPAAREAHEPHGAGQDRDRCRAASRHVPIVDDAQSYQLTASSGREKTWRASRPSLRLHSSPSVGFERQVLGRVAPAQALARAALGGAVQDAGRAGRLARRQPERAALRQPALQVRVAGEPDLVRDHAPTVAHRAQPITVERPAVDAPVHRLGVVLAGHQRRRTGAAVEGDPGVARLARRLLLVRPDLRHRVGVLVGVVRVGGGVVPDDVLAGLDREDAAEVEGAQAARRVHHVEQVADPGQPAGVDGDRPEACPIAVGGRLDEEQEAIADVGRVGGVDERDAHALLRAGARVLVALVVPADQQDAPPVDAPALDAVARPGDALRDPVAHRLVPRLPGERARHAGHVARQILGRDRLADAVQIAEHIGDRDRAELLGQPVDQLTAVAPRAGVLHRERAAIDRGKARALVDAGLRRTLRRLSLARIRHHRVRASVGRRSTGSGIRILSAVISRLAIVAGAGGQQREQDDAP